MSRTTARAPLNLNGEQRSDLEKTARSTTAPFRERQRANILLRYSCKMSITRIQKDVGVSRPSIYKCIDKALESGAQAGLKDLYHRPKEPTITNDAKTWPDFDTFLDKGHAFVPISQVFVP